MTNDSAPSSIQADGGPPFIKGVKEHWRRMVAVALVAALWRV